MFYHFILNKFYSLYNTSYYQIKQTIMVSTIPLTLVLLNDFHRVKYKISKTFIIMFNGRTQVIKHKTNLPFITRCVEKLSN